MRIKALVCAAAFAAGIVSSMAQSNVYSLNVVGYYNTPVANGFTMIANQLNTTNNTIGALIPTAPDFSALYKYTGSGFAIATMFFGSWDDGSFTLNPGEGAIIQTTTPFTNTFVGEVMQGALVNAFPAGFSIRSSMVPQAGPISTLGLTPANFTDFDIIYLFNTGTQSYDIYTLFFGSWSPSEPSVKVGESMWLQTAAPGSWNRNFTVN